VFEMEPEKTGNSSGTLQCRHISVQVHPVNATTSNVMQRHAFPEDFGDRSR
jgi:hypothetical protein